jgi:homocysteine S-methyltransferase
VEKVENLKRRLAKREIIIMDGGMGTEILHRGMATPLPLWSSYALLHHPKIVQQIHEDYIRAGAEILITDTFRTTRRAFAKENMAEKATEMTHLACELAQRAIEQTKLDHEVYIAGSIAPLEDCYSPELTPSALELEKEHDEFVADLKDGGVDFLLFETMITLRETLSGLRAAKRHALPFAISFCCNGSLALLGGEALGDVIPEIEQYQPLFVGINCISVESAHKLVKYLRGITTFPVAVYAQGHAIVGDVQRWQVEEEKSVEAYLKAARRWVEDGAQVIGGCCGTTPAYIHRLAIALRS